MSFTVSQIHFLLLASSSGRVHTYGDEDGLYNFYVELYKIILQQGAKEAKKELKRTLPVISKRGSKDDMSIACVYDDSNPSITISLLIKYQISQVEKDIIEVQNKIDQLKKKISNLNDNVSLSSSEQIVLNYAQKDVDELMKKLNQLNDKKSKLSAEIGV